MNFELESGGAAAIASAVARKKLLGMAMASTTQTLRMYFHRALFIMHIMIEFNT